MSEETKVEPIEDVVTTPEGEETKPEEKAVAGEESKSEETPKEETPEEKPTPEAIKQEAKGVDKFVTDAGLTQADLAKEMNESAGKLGIESVQKLIDQHGESVASLVIDKLQNLYTRSQEVSTAKNQSIYDRVEKAYEGITTQTGEESWKELAAWAKDNVSNEHRAEINAMINQGGLAAELAIDDLVSAHKERSLGTQSAELEDGDNLLDKGAKPGIGKSAYLKELNKLLDAGHDYNTSPEVQRLNVQRQRGLTRNIK